MQITVLKRPGRANPATLTCYIADEVLDNPPIRPAMLVCPGGGYEFVAPREGEPIALAYVRAGFNAFVLDYAIKEQALFPNSLTDAMWALGTIRTHSQEFHIDPHKVAVCGFSAGGHLAASLCVFHDRPDIAVQAGFPCSLLRPDAGVLSYPVISAGPFRDEGSIRQLLGDRYGEADAMNEVSLERQVKATTPPCFLWHTADDDCVPVANSLLFASALSMHQVPFEMHIFPQGPHGLSLGEKWTSQQHPSHIWMDLSIQWLDRLFDR